MARLHRLLRDAWAMAAPYWRSEERWVARALLVSAVGLNLGMSTQRPPQPAEQCAAGQELRGVGPAARPRRDMKAGITEQSNFDMYRLVRMPDAPRALHVELLDTDAPPGGIGEPGGPPVAPAIAHAIFVLTGQRIRTLPLMLAGVV